jgi:hypothetical protein
MRNYANQMAHEMTVFLTVFDSCLAAMRRGYGLVTPFNNIARCVERMLGSSIQPQEPV